MNRRVFVGDFGAGNTCLYVVNPDAEIPAPTELNDPNGEPSGYALYKNGNVSLGFGLYKIPFENLSEIDHFHINLKAQPSRENRAELVRYFRNWLDKLKHERAQEFDNIDEAYWFIGSPTGGQWKEASTRQLYKSIFEEAGFENVFIIPESNAALAYYQKKDKILDMRSSQTKLLLIDQGAYSLDATYYYGGEVTSFGSYLGASIIERMMLHVILYTDEEKIRLKKQMHNLPQVTEYVRGVYEQEGPAGKLYTYLLLKARQLKESYFTSQRQGTLKDSRDYTLGAEMEDCLEGEDFVLFINKALMDRILYEYSVKNVLGKEFYALAPEVQSELGNQTWMQAFRRYLDQLTEHYPVLKNGNDVIIMLTGGGSQMQCIAGAVQEKFPQASIHDDFKAVSAIGKGMAYWAPDKINALDFENAFEQFVNAEEVDEDGDTLNCVNQKLSMAFVASISPLMQNIVAEEYEAVKYGIEQWREYKCNSAEIPAKIEQHFRDWCRDSGIPSFQSEIQEQLKSLKADLNNNFNSVLDEFSIPREDILKQDDHVFLSDTTRMLPLVFDCIVEVIVNHYKKLDVWATFENGKKRIFSDARSDFYNSLVETLNEWLDKETDSTFDLCKNAFTDVEFELSDDFKCTLIYLFIIEGRIDLTNLMKKHVKEILGKLVLEEYLDDTEE